MLIVEVVSNRLGTRSVSGCQSTTVGVLHEYIQVEQCAVVHFLWAKGLSTKEMHCEMCPMYGDNCFSQKTVFNWIQEFNKGSQSIRDQEHPGRPAEVSTETTVQHVEWIIRNDQHVSIDGIAHAVGCSHGTVYIIMHEQLKFRKVCAQWTPCRLSEEEKMFRMGLYLQHLNWSTEEGEDFMARIVMGDESWVHHFQLESKRCSMEWNHSTSPTKKSLRQFHQPTRLCPTCFGKFHPHGENVNAISYCRNSSLTVRMWMPHHTAPLCGNSDSLFTASDLDHWQREWFFWMTKHALTQQEKHRNCYKHFIGIA